MMLPMHCPMPLAILPLMHLQPRGHHYTSHDVAHALSRSAVMGHLVQDRCSVTAMYKIILIESASSHINSILKSRTVESRDQIHREEG